jgi:DNA (cytosine-5)-methyltransferase 1
MTAWYNENDPFAAAWLRELIKAGLIAPGDVDERSIVDVRPDDLRGYSQCHFFAGIGGWSYALRLAGWDDARPVWTGSCPCQPFSKANLSRRGFADSRHLWPAFRALIAERRPAIVFGEQVTTAADWLGLVRGDLEALAYAVGAIPIEAASAGADHLRDRFWFVADADDARLARRQLLPERADREPPRPHGVADASKPRPPHRHGRAVQGAAKPERASQQPERCGGFAWVRGADGKERRVKPGIRLLAHGFPGRVGLLRGFGNAIDPRPAAAFIRAADEAMRAA